MIPLKPSPFAPASFPPLPAIDGVQIWTAQTGARYKNRPDVLLARLAPGSRVAGVFTKSTAPGAPVQWSKSVLAGHKKTTKFKGPAGLMVNAGNANVFTGQRGKDGVADMANIGADLLGCAPEEMFICSTGVIGEPLGLGPIKGALTPDAGMGDPARTSTWAAAAQAISTTDTFPKGASAAAQIDGAAVQIAGIAKGSGMIAPDMATMLGFIFTDANISRAVLQSLLAELCETSFNAITVDSDTSTSDTVLLAATAAAAHDQIRNAADPRLADFRTALSGLMLDLAHQIVKDGEGAQKFVSVTVTGAQSDKAAKAIGMSIANSPLVKTAIAGEDANWGRIVMAVGKSGEKADRDKLKIQFGPHVLAEKGVRSEGYDEAVVSAYMRGQNLEIQVDVGIENGTFTVWTCDLTHGYIDINADYRS